MKCALELLDMAKRAEALRIERETKEFEEMRLRTIHWCDTVLSNYLEDYAINKPASFSQGEWTKEYEDGHPTHFRVSCDNKIIFPLTLSSGQYSNGDKSLRADGEPLDITTIVNYCKESCIEVRTNDRPYKCYGAGQQPGLELCFRIAPECL